MAYDLTSLEYYDMLLNITEQTKGLPMGVFDEVAFECPSCKRGIYAQSKAGDCNMATYDKHDVPIALAADLDGTTVHCNGCGESFTVMSALPVNRVAMTLR